MPSTAAGSATPRSGGGRRRGNRAGRQSGHGASTAGGQGTNNRTRTVTSFKGNTEEMNGNVFECYEEVDDHLQYGNTIEALDAYTRKNLLYSADLAPLFVKKATAPSIERPEETTEEPDTLSGMIFAEK